MAMEFLTLSQITTEYGFSSRTIRGWCNRQQRNLPVIKTGTLWKIERKDLENFLEREKERR